MRDDYSRAASSLRLLGEAIRDCPEQHRERRSAYIVKLARLARDNPLVCAAVLEAERQEHADEEAFAARVRELSGKAQTVFKRLLDLVAPKNPGASPLGEPVMKIISAHKTLNVHTSAPETFIAVNKAIRSGNTVEFSPADVAMFNANFATKVREAVKPLADDDPEVDDVLAVFEDFGVLGESAAVLLEAEQLLKRASIGRLARRLRERAERWDAYLADASSPGTLLADGIEHDLPFFVATVAVALEEGVIRLFALHRLRVLFEEFDCAELRTSLAAAEAVKDSREKILQRAMDRFLFHDGYFPVTHSSASRGFMDTLLLENAESSGVPPLLVELKQVTAFANPAEASRAAVVAAIAIARGEVARYRGHVATRPQWAGTMPMIVVVHTCAEDLSDLEAADVVLIDLSATTPSKKKPRRPTS